MAGLTGQDSATGRRVSRASHQGLLLVGLPLLVNFLFLYALIFIGSQHAAERERLSQSDRLEDLSMKVVRRVDELQRAARGYVLTEDPAFRAPFEAAAARLPEELDALRGFSSERLAPRAEIERAAALAGQSLRLQRSLVGLVDEGRREEAIGRVAASFGSGPADRLRLVIDDLLAGAQRQQVAARAASARVIRNLEIVVVVGVGVNVLLAILAVFLFGRVVRRLNVVAANTLRLRGGRELLAPLTPGDEIAEVDSAFHEMASQLKRSQSALEREADLFARIISVQEEVAMANPTSGAVTRLVVDRTRELVRADGAAIEMAEGDQMVYRAVNGIASPFEGLRLRLDSSLSGLAVRTGKLLQSTDTETDERVDREACRRIGVRSMVVVPLMVGKGPVGVLKVMSRRPDAFDHSDVMALRMMASFIAANLQRALLFEKSEATIIEQFQELKTLQHRFVSFMDNSPAVAFIKDPEGRYIYLSETLKRVAGIDPDELLGRTDFERLPAAQAIEIRQREMEILSGGEPQQSVDPVPGPNGTTRHWLTFRFGLNEAGRRLIGGLVVDVTARVKAEAEVRRLNTELEQRVAERTDELQRANRELEAFSYSVSHDLKAPLRAVDGYARMLDEDFRDRLDDEGKRLLGVIRENAGRMGALIDDLLQFSRLGRQRLSISQTLDLSAMARQVAAELQNAEPGRLIEFQIADTPPVPADPALLRQVLHNLISNALKFTSTREIARVEFGADERSGKVTFYVQDNGVGFDMRHANKLFGVFQRLHHIDEFEGTGVGLAIVKRVVERHGGQVSAEAEPERGARFSFSLPAVASQAAEPAALASKGAQP